jgi:capsular polysaccharide biosynthesis protein
MSNDEVDLVEVIKIILKRKKIFLAIFILAILIVSASSILNYQNLKKIETVSTILEIGKADSTLIEEPNLIAEKIKNNIYGDTIKESLHLEEVPEINALSLNNANLLKIEITSQNPEEAKLILETLNNLILKEHQQKLSDLEKTEKLLLELSIETKVIKEPSLIEKETAFPLKKFIINLVIAAFVSILVGILICFILEFWEKNKDRIVEADKRGPIRG